MADKSLFFLVLSLCCFWLFLDELYGHLYISQFVTKILPNED